MFVLVGVCVLTTDSVLIMLPWSLVTMPDCCSDGQKLSCGDSTMFHLKIDIC